MQLQSCNPPKGLYIKILNEITRIKRRSAIKKFTAASIVGCSALVALLVVGSNTINMLNESGFYKYVMLFFSDYDALIDLWSVFVLSTIEAIPLETVTLFLALLFVCIATVTTCSNQLKLIGDKLKS